MKKSILPAVLCLALYGQTFAAKVIPNNDVANLVLGQTDFVTGTAGNPPSSFSLNDPRSVVIDPVSRKVFVADHDNARILRYPSVDALANGAGAEAVFGQNRFSTGATSGGDQGFQSLSGIFLDRKGRLWIADDDNNRVLMFESAIYRSSNPFADRVYGQPDFTTVTTATTAAKMNSPYYVVVDSSDRLWVSDGGNQRVLRFDSISSKPSGASADGVLGQSDFVSFNSGLSASKFNYPLGLAVSSSGALFVSDWGNNRILRFDNAGALGNGAGATVVLGQPDFVTGAFQLTANGMSLPWGLALTPENSLWVCEESNKRAIRFDNATTLSNGAAAKCVVGQPNFTTNTAGTTNRNLAGSLYAQPFVDATGSLWIPDSGNNRVLRFPPDLTKPLLTLTGTVPKTVNKKTVVIKGTATDTYGISKVQYRIGTGALKTASGTTSWQFTASLKKGKNTITIFATDSVGNVSLSKVVRVKRK
jgi:sugar lactone lactonase YvrE